MKKNVFVIVLAICQLCAVSLMAQVTTNFNNPKMIDGSGRFAKTYKVQTDFVIPPKDIKALLENERKAQGKDEGAKPFQFAEPVSVDLNLAKAMQWRTDKDFAYGRYAIKATGATSTSINFDQFFLPANTELYVYNANGNMITGPVTEKENNPNRFWGSWAYEGEELFVEVKTPSASLDQLVLHSNNIAYGYKSIYAKVGSFGVAGLCNINVICPLGTGWEPERNSVALILNAAGNALCTGALIMNTCGTDKPYLLTADHCFTGQNVALWKFTFQAWSATCTPSANSTGITFNGSTFRANYTPSDMCLVELNTKPAANSGLHYAGWSRSTTPATRAMGIHHPRGDVMKISEAANPVAVATYTLPANHHWRANWTQGVTEKGSSGSPLFDQNHRIIGQLHGGPSGCGSSQQWDFYGRFDISWTGGGTNSTRLSNWLDPGGTGAMTTNTTNRSALHTFVSNNFNLMSYDDALDVGNEPNAQSIGITQSNDIWNRRNSVGSPNDHQNPGYSNPLVNNIMKLRIKNVGCQASPVAHAKMYWTMGSMGEQWPIDWDGTSQLCGVAASGEVTTANIGQLYVPGLGFRVPALQPSQTFVVEGKWKPKNPFTDYACKQPDMGGTPMICLLGRILSSADPMFSEPPGSIFPNVRNNNNIVTRNTSLINLPGSFKLNQFEGGTVLAHNRLDIAARFSIRFRAATGVDAGFGNIGTTVITLSDEMWQSWVQGGSRAEGMALSNANTHEFTVYDLQNAVLHNIEMQPGDYMNIGAGFMLNAPVDAERQEFRFVMSQELTDRALLEPTGEAGDETPYGSDCVYVVIISDEEAAAASIENDHQVSDDQLDANGVGVTGLIGVTASALSRNMVKTTALTVKPNPANNQVTLQFNMPSSGTVAVTLTDANGRVIKTLGERLACIKGANQLSFTTHNIQAGTYWVVLSTPTGKQTTKLLIAH
jgi:hypothetical protein